MGKSLYIPCRASAQSEVRVEWSKIQENGSSQSLGSELNFNSVVQDDSGNYECRARSTGTDEEDLVGRMRLNVTGKYVVIV